MGCGYPAVLTIDDNDTVMVTFPDVPEEVTFGADEAAALAQAVDALETVIWSRMRAHAHVPLPSPAAKGQRTVHLPARTMIKVALYRAMREQGVRKADLARMLGGHQAQVDRMLDLTHSTKIETLETALALLGRRLDVTVRELA